MIKSKKDMVYQHIKRDILEGRYQNESRLTERGLAKELNVTRVPVRESLVHLEQDGLIKKIPATGYIVDNYSHDELDEAVVMRFVIECQAASKAAESATADDIKELRRLNEAMKNAGRACNMEVAAKLDREFHFGLVTASHCKILKKLYSMMTIPVFMPPGAPSYTDAVLTAEGHEKLINAIEENDSEAAFSYTFNNTPGLQQFLRNFTKEVVQKKHGLNIK